jgi:hypothetical protein
VATAAAAAAAVLCPSCDPCPTAAGGSDGDGGATLQAEAGTSKSKTSATAAEAATPSATPHDNDAVPKHIASHPSSRLSRRPSPVDHSRFPALTSADDPTFDWTNIVDDALNPYPVITKEDVDSAEVKVRESVNAFRGQIIGGRLFIRDIRSLQFAREFAASWKITLLETMRRHRDLPDVDIVFNEGDYPIVQIPKDGAHQQRLYGRSSNGMKPPPVFSPTQSEMSFDIPFPDFSFSPPGNQGKDQLNTNRWVNPKP